MACLPAMTNRSTFVSDIGRDVLAVRAHARPVVDLKGGRECFSYFFVTAASPRWS
jgi:hypothetical protein